jgi:hypothetical protein
MFEAAKSGDHIEPTSWTKLGSHVVKHGSPYMHERLAKCGGSGDPMGYTEVDNITSIVIRLPVAASNSLHRD